MTRKYIGVRLAAVEWDSVDVCGVVYGGARSIGLHTLDLFSYRIASTPYITNVYVESGNPLPLGWSVWPFQHFFHLRCMMCECF